MFHPSVRLLDRAAKWFGLQKSALSYRISLGQEDKPFSPLITIARDPGSGGRPIAELVAKKLKFQFFDEELIDQIAETWKKNKSVIAKIDEKPRGMIEDIVHSMMNPDYVSDIEYLQQLAKSIAEISQKGEAVILGRGANCLLKPEAGLHVLITAPHKTRVGNAIKFEKMSRKKAEKTIAQVSTERERFVNEYFQKQYSHPDSYDLVINTASLDLDQAANMIVEAFKAKFT